MAHRCAIPPESCRGRLSRYSSNPTSLGQAPRPGRIRPLSGQRRCCAARSAREKPRLLKDHADSGGRPPHLLSVQTTEPAYSRSSPATMRKEGALAAAAGPKKADDLPLPTQAHLGEGVAVGKGLVHLRGSRGCRPRLYRLAMVTLPPAEQRSRSFYEAIASICRRGRGRRGFRGGGRAAPPPARS